MKDKISQDKIIKATDFQSYLAKQLRNPEFKNHYDKYGKQLEATYAQPKLGKINISNPTKPD